MIPGVRLMGGQYGRRAVVTARLSHTAAQQLAAGGVLELELNHGKGWRGTDLSFLAGMPQLQALEITDYTIRSVEPIHHLTQLRKLTVPTYCRTPIRFHSFPLLEECALEWRKGAESLFERGSLRKLFIDRYSEVDTSPFRQLVGLEWLTLLGGRVADLGGLGSLGKLRFLRLGDLRHLRSLAGIEGLTNLEELVVQTCRQVESIQPIGHLRRIRRLNISDNGSLDSLAPLGGLNELESVLFYESTNIVDGDLSPLQRLPRLFEVSFVDRPHYSARQADFAIRHTIRRLFARRPNRSPAG